MHQKFIEQSVSFNWYFHYHEIMQVKLSMLGAKRVLKCLQVKKQQLFYFSIFTRFGVT